uniref:Uncharacterized protein LOC113795577 n=1 Tax=Dermatophagoides pteronyssinus TaxID=6956 RepID=A0A6P6YAF7_DERPT|nr:uncharacterized protein LOC113795577 [Dermatophagoides pteronyssinus]
MMTTMDPNTLLVYKKLVEAKKQIDEAIAEFQNLSLLSQSKTLPIPVKNDSLEKNDLSSTKMVNGDSDPLKIKMMLDNGDSIAPLNKQSTLLKIIRSSNESLKMNGKIDQIEGSVQDQQLPTKTLKNSRIQDGTITLSLVYSSRNFYVNFDYDKMIDFYKKLNEDYFEMDQKLITLMPYDVIVDRIYAVLNPADESYYRAKVIDFQSADSKVKIILYDYGEEMIFERKNIFRLLPPYDKEPPFAVNCFLNEKWTEDFCAFDSAMLKYLEDGIAMEGKFAAPLLNCKRIPVSIKIELPNKKLDNFTSIDHGVEICDFIAQHKFNYEKFFQLNPIDWEKLSKSFQLLDSNTGFSNSLKMDKAWIVKVDDIDNFLIMSEQSYSKSELNNFITNISHFYDSSYDMMFTDVKPNDLAVIKYQDYFFRALILSENVANENFEIFAFDIGFVGNVKKTEIFHLLDIFSLEKFQPFIFSCRVHKLVPIKENWSSIAITTFKKLCKNAIKINVRGFVGGKLQIEIFNGETSIQTLFVRCRFAKPIE